jgi:hypothetical protein
MALIFHHFFLKKRHLKGAINDMDEIHQTHKETNIYTIEK